MFIFNVWISKVVKLCKFCFRFDTMFGILWSVLIIENWRLIFISVATTVKTKANRILLFRNPLNNFFFQFWNLIAWIAFSSLKTLDQINFFKIHRAISKIVKMQFIRYSVRNAYAIIIIALRCQQHIRLRFNCQQRRRTEKIFWRTRFFEIDFFSAFSIQSNRVLLNSTETSEFSYYTFARLNKYKRIWTSILKFVHFTANSYCFSRSDHRRVLGK